MFHYQLVLPPLKTQRLTRFALELVRDRPGLWQTMPDLADVVSILIPTHVTSPRRVKALLNSFILTYRVARARAGTRLEAEVAARAGEIAKLVCLRLEFPLFARDLESEPRLAPVVTEMLTSSSAPAFIDPALTELARAYVDKKRPVATVIADRRANADEESQD